MDTPVPTVPESEPPLGHRCFDMVWVEGDQGVEPKVFEVWPPFPTVAEITAMFPDAFDLPPF